MEIVKYGDYVIYGRTSTDFWKETSVDIIIHVRKNIYQARPDQYKQNFQTGLLSMVQISKMLQICMHSLNVSLLESARIISVWICDDDL